MKQYAFSDDILCENKRKVVDKNIKLRKHAIHPEGLQVSLSPPTLCMENSRG
jgi:hypothetical protein